MVYQWAITVGILIAIVRGWAIVSVLREVQSASSASRRNDVTTGSIAGGCDDAATPTSAADPPAERTHASTVWD